MKISKKILIMGSMVTWLIIIVSCMFLAGSFDIEVLFVLWLIGILIITELADTRYVRPRYLKKIMIFAGTGTVLFVILVLRKVWGIIYG
ncbi:MAG TPA: hypothetical protein PK024_09320 [Methanospirillum sp.]|uniref:hypothetical protein n=1 Tax=Methanospirillum sp. TaxID=45200 RepID=UPI002B979867|nr:hypothetical protein [Methanospirillum sp.]HOJ97018.1 hypothetical protein [Methanospirillum sp.]HOL41341.1 hypothetical protein [Methanospirillum sp.]HPP78546.1 hypothetical protein [Methanospirillum sp.]